MLASFTTSHEGRYERRNVDEIPADRLLGLPLLVELPGLAWVAVLEANLTDHAGMYLERAREPGGRLVSRLSPRPDEPKVAVRAALPHDSPWRLVLIGAEARQLLESDTVLKLNAPSAIQDVSWIRPGKTTFPWWNDYFEAGRVVQDGSQYRDGEVLHRFLRGVRHSVSHARRGKRPGMVRRTHRALRRRRHHPGHRRAGSPGGHRLRAAEGRADPAVDALAGGASGTWPAHFRSIARGASKA